MERKHILVPLHFFKVMMADFHLKLKLPRIVSKELKKYKSKRVILESGIGTWRVSLCKNYENGLLCLNQGWPQFVERHALKIGDFVVFEHTGYQHFDVSIFNTNCCKNQLLDYKEEDEEEEGNETLIPLKKNTIEEEEEGVGEEREFFEKTMIPSYASNRAVVNIPTEFMRRNKLRSKCRRVVLIDPIGREWDVTLCESTKQRIFCRMRTGWLYFYTTNALKDGDICVFRLNRRLLKSTTIVFNVKIVRAK